MASLKEIQIFLRSNGLSGSLRTLLYTLQLRRLEKPYRKTLSQTARQPLQVPGRLLEMISQPGGARFIFEHANLEIRFLAPDLARLSWEPGHPPAPYAIAKNAAQWSPVETQIHQNNGNFHLVSAAQHISVAADGGISFFTLRGDCLRASTPPQFRLLPDEPAWTDSFRLKEDELLYGLGEHAGPLNLRGLHLRIWNNDPAGSYAPGRDPLYMPMPVILSLSRVGSYLAFYENSYPGTFHADASPSTPGIMDAGIARFAFEGGMLRYYLIAGEPTTALQRFTELTGRPPLPPRWALGYHQSRWGYKSKIDIRQVVETFEQLNLPLSAIHLDIDYMRGFRVFTVDEQRFPNLAELSTELSSRGVRLVTIIDPGIKRDPEYEVFRSGHNQGMFLLLPDGREFYGVVWPGWSAFPDFTHPKARQWWSDWYAQLTDLGVAGFWHDMNEPTSFTLDGSLRLPLNLKHNLDGQGGDHRQAHNLYALQMNRAAYEGLRQTLPNHRPWIISRSGWVSNQRYAWNWTGDIESTWEALRLTIAQIIHCGLSGQPFIGPDIGGFSGNPSAELYLRWFQMATFLPFFRTHSALTTMRREPWTYGEPYTSIIRQYLRLRYRLLPYLYTLAWEAHKTGAPLVRPLFWLDTHQTQLWTVDDAFLLGDALLVAPFLESGQTRRVVLLPRGGWYNFWDDHLFNGGALLELNGDLEHIPLMVRAGSLLPLENDDKLEIHLYPPGPEDETIHSSLIYTDSGDGYGDHRLYQFTIQRRKNKLLIECRSRGDYPLLIDQASLVQHGQSLDVAWREGPPLSPQD